MACSVSIISPPFQFGTVIMVTDPLSDSQADGALNQRFASFHPHYTSTRPLRCPIISVANRWLWAPPPLFSYIITIIFTHIYYIYYIFPSYIYSCLYHNLSTSPPRSLTSTLIFFHPPIEQTVNRPDLSLVVASHCDILIPFPPHCSPLAFQTFVCVRTRCA